MVDPVAIVGMAAVFPGASDLDGFWDNVVGGVDAIGPVPSTRIDPVFFEANATAPDRFYCNRGGFVDPALPFDPTEFGIMPIAAAEAEPDQLLALATASRALTDAGYSGDQPRRTGVIIGRGGYITPGIARLEQRVRTAQQLAQCVGELLPDLPPEQIDAIRHAFQAQLGPSHPETSIGLVPSLVASRIANRLDLDGPAYTVDAACASSLVAVEHAVDALTLGRCDLVVAGGVHHCHDLTLWSVFSQLRALSPSGRIRPFDRRADGILVGEGTGMVVLKRLADAERDGDRIYAVVRGVGLASDGRSSTLMNPAVDGQVAAVERAWTTADLDPSTVGLVEAHGTGTPAGDAAEIATLQRVFGGSVEPVAVGSVKSMIGHAMPASGIAGLIKSSLALFHQVVPPTLHCEEPHPDLAGSRFVPVGEARGWESNGHSRRAGVNAFGFGGINAHVVLEEHGRSAGSMACSPSSRKAVRQVPVDRPTSGGTHAPRLTGVPRRGVAERLFLAAAERPDDLLAQLDDETAILAGTSLLTVAGSAPPLRLAIADPTAKRIALARKVVARGTAWRGRNDVWFAPSGLLTGASGGKIAFAFPGVEPTLAPELADVAAHFGIVEPEAPVATEIGKHGMGIIRVGRLLVEAMGQLGVGADVIVGHSLGEWTAMIVSETVPDEVVDIFVGGLVAGELVLPDLVFLAVGCAAETARSVIDGLPDIAVSHDNCPHQAIICGSEPSIAVVQERLKERRVMGQVLPFRTGFHTRMFGDYLAPFQRCLGGLPLDAPRIPMWSSVTAAPFPLDRDGIRDVAIRLYTEQVRFRELVENLYTDGVRVFVQPGLGSVTGFVDDTLRDREHLTIAAAVANRSGMAQLARVAASLWVEGADVHFERLVAPTLTPRSHDTVVRLDQPLIRGSQQPLDVLAPAFSVRTRKTGARTELEDEAQRTLRLVEDAEREVMAALANSATQNASWTRRFSVAEVPELIDHAFFRQPDGVGTIEDRFPVVPMTMMVGLFVEAAQRVAPDRVVIGLQNVRALRWLAVEPAADVIITAAHAGPDRVKVSIDGFSRAVVRLGDAYPSPPPPDTRPLAGERPAPHTAVELYEERLMFHGPAYRGVVDIHTLGEDGVRGAIAALPAPGALLDAAGQFVGYWVMVETDRDNIALPMRIERIDFFAPPPPVGTRLDVSVRFVEVTSSEAAADIEIVGRDGVMWGRMSSFTDRRFDTNDPVLAVMLFEETNGLAERGERPGSWVVRKQWQSVATRELLMRRYLGERERAEYAALSALAQGPWLLGRIAIKDAVRATLWERGAGPLYPIEVQVATDDRGELYVVGPDGFRPRISLSLTDDEAVVAVHEHVLQTTT